MHIASIKADDTISNGVMDIDNAKPISSVHRLYAYQKQIGRGACGKVFLVQSKTTHRQFAMKQMPKSDPQNRHSFTHELQILKTLNHSHIIRLNDAYISQNHYYLTTEYCCGGTLSERVIKMKRFSERQAARVIKQTLEAVNYMHSKHIVHRDLKPSNIVLDRFDNVKLIDFGESELITDGTVSDRLIIGSLYSLPPETLQPRLKSDLFPGDVWAVGVVAYVMIAGVFPFIADDVRSMMRCIRKSQLKWHNATQITDNCKDFITSMLNKDMNLRLTARQALHHEWITTNDEQAMAMNVEDDVSYKMKLAMPKRCTKERRVDTESMMELSDNDLKEILTEIDIETANFPKDVDDAMKSTESKETQSRHSQKYSHTSDISDESLHEMDINHILATIDAEIKSPRSKVNDNVIDID
eukprot:140191_1